MHSHDGNSFQSRQGRLLSGFCLGFVLSASGETAALPAELAAADAPASSRPNFMNMDRSALMNVSVHSAAGLIRTELRKVPVTMTELDARDIQQSGARDLNHLLEACVPNAQSAGGRCNPHVPTALAPTRRSACAPARDCRTLLH